MGLLGLTLNLAHQSYCCWEDNYQMKLSNDDYKGTEAIAAKGSYANPAEPHSSLIYPLLLVD